MAQEFRQVAVKIDGILDEEIISQIRKISGDLEQVSNTNLHTSIGGPISGKLLEDEMEESYQKCKYALDLI